MPKARQVLIAAAAGLSISMLPVQFDAFSFDGGVAYAKDGNNGGGKGNGGGQSSNSGKGNGGGKSANSGKSGGNGKAAGRSGKNQTRAARSSGKSEGGLLKSLIRGNSGKAGSKSTKTANTKSRGSKKSARPELPVTTAAIPVVNPEAKVKNLNARLGSLNSLKRNVNAYMNSNSPGMVAVREYVMGAAEAQLVTDAAVDAAEEKLAGLEAQLLELETIDTTKLTDADLAALQAEKYALVPAIQAAADELALAEQAAAEAHTTDPEALDDALTALGNPNLVLDDEIREWATDVLDGKIEEVKGILAAEAEQEPVEPVIEPVTEPVEPDPLPLLPEEPPAPEM